MKILLRWVSPDITEVKAVTSDTTIEIGWLCCEHERKQLAEHLREVADDLYPLDLEQ